MILCVPVTTVILSVSNNSLRSGKGRGTNIVLDIFILHSVFSVLAYILH